MKYALLQEIIELLETYEKECSEAATIQSFTLWLNEKVLTTVPSTHTETPPDAEHPNWMISAYVSFMNKYAKIYIKKALQGSPFAGADDFAYLMTLCYEGSMTKTELIQRNVSEVPSGMEVIKRLERNELIKSFSDTKDKRATRVAATVKGQNALGAVYQEMERVAAIIAGNLTLSERIELIVLLKKLHHFHFEIYQNDLKSDLSIIEQKKVKSEK